jgi:O-antigen/teichoic acid export membrane protein
MLRLAQDRDEISVVNDQIGCPTNAVDLAEFLIKIIEKVGQTSPSGIEGLFGIYNFTGNEVMSWYDFALKIFKENNITIKVNPIPTSAYPTPAKRPKYSVLDNSKRIFRLNKFLSINDETINGFKTLFLRGFGLVLLFLFTSFFTKNYSENIVGKYDFIRTFLLVLGSFTSCGLEQSVLYFSGKAKVLKMKNNLKSLYFQSLKILFIAAICPLILFVILGKEQVNNFFNDDCYIILFKAILILFFYNLYNYNTEFLRALDKINISEIFRNIIKYIAIIISSILLLDLEGKERIVDCFLLGFVVFSTLSSIIIINNFKSKNQLLEQIVNSKDLLKKSYPMAFSNMAIFLLISIDVFMLKREYGNKIVAYYSTAVKLMTILGMVIVAINTTYSMKISELYHSKKIEKLAEITKEASKIIAKITIPVTIVIIIFSKQILLFFGANYINAQVPLIILIASQGLCSLFGTANIYMNMTDKEKIFQRILVISVMINFISNSFLIPKYNMIGASISFSISLFFWNFATVFYAYKKDKIKLYFRL